MNGPGHFNTAEQLLQSASESLDDGNPSEARALVATAQVHATLALAAATAAPVAEHHYHRQDDRKQLERDAECWAETIRSAPKPTPIAGALRSAPFAGVPTR